MTERQKKTLIVLYHIIGIVLSFFFIEVMTVYILFGILSTIRILFTDDSNGELYAFDMIICPLTPVILLIFWIKDIK